VENSDGSGEVVSTDAAYVEEDEVAVVATTVALFTEGDEIVEVSTAVSPFTEEEEMPLLSAWLDCVVLVIIDYSIDCTRKNYETVGK
jgi:hypothetical protein